MLKTVLITRPKAQAEELKQALEQVGAKTVLFPTIDIIPVDNIALDNTIENLNQTDLAIFISANAVRHSVNKINKRYGYFPQQLKVAAMGPATRDALYEHGVQVDMMPDDHYSSEGLLEIGALQDLSNKKVTLIKGIGGREHLANSLRNRGAQLTEANCYRRALPSVDTKPLLNQLHEQKIDLIISTSIESLQNLMTLLGEEGQKNLAALECLVISERMADYAKCHCKFKSILRSKDASTQAIIEKIREGR